VAHDDGLGKTRRQKKKREGADAKLGQQLVEKYDDVKYLKMCRRTVIELVNCSNQRSH
jgi:hypothetical protein